MKTKTIVIIGAGAAGLMAATTLINKGFRIDVYDAMKTAGRKFLVAGEGGLNLTHSENIETFISRYGQSAKYFNNYLKEFSPEDLRIFFKRIGIETFVGSSGRVFPLKGIKPAQVLTNWINYLVEHKVNFYFNYEWLGFTANQNLQFRNDAKEIAIPKPHATILALGGASWTKTGSTGKWTEILKEHNITINPFKPSNCGFDIAWSDYFKNTFEGKPLKNCSLKINEHATKGELTFTSTGIEGGVVYALSQYIRNELENKKEVYITIDLKPDLTKQQIGAKLTNGRGNKSVSSFLAKALNFNSLHYSLLREVYTSEELNDFTQLPSYIKSLSLKIQQARPIKEAISTAGGISFEEVNEHLMLKKMPGVFVAGEMLDWEAPTGGYLLQGAFATGNVAAMGAMSY